MNLLPYNAPCLHQWDNSYMGRRHSCIDSYYSEMYKSQHNLYTFGSSFLGLEAALDRQNSTKRFLSSSTYLLTPLLNFFWDQKKHGQKSTKRYEVPLMVFIENQTIAFFTLKTKTFTMVYEPFSTSGGFLTYASLRWKPTYVQTARAAAGLWLTSQN